MQELCFILKFHGLTKLLVPRNLFSRLTKLVYVKKDVIMKLALRTIQWTCHRAVAMKSESLPKK